jgi:hypothetical protein
MFKPWNPTKYEIEIWLAIKEIEFMHKDNINPKYTQFQYFERFVFIDLHEAFFCYFPELVQEWILRLKENHPTNWIRLVEWTTENLAWI